MNTKKAPELVGRAASSFGAALIAILVPKCPLCVAAYLAGFGLSAAAAARAAVFVRPSALVLAAVTLVALAFGVWQRRTRTSAPRCCNHLGERLTLVAKGGHPYARARKET